MQSKPAALKFQIECLCVSTILHNFALRQNLILESFQLYLLVVC